MSDNDTIESQSHLESPPESPTSPHSTNHQDSPSNDQQAPPHGVQSTNVRYSQITTAIPLRITFRNITYSVPIKKKKKPLRQFFKKKQIEGGGRDVEANNQESRNLGNNNTDNNEEEGETFLGRSGADEAAGLQGITPWMALGGGLVEPPTIQPSRREREEAEASETNAVADNSDDAHQNRKKILNDVSGVFREGRLTAIIGSSGAGKTTLLSLLAGDVSRNSVVTGQVLVNNMDVTASRKMKKISAFVFQDDLLLETMTVEEAIRQSLLLRSPPNMTKEEREEKLQEALKMFRIQHAAKTTVGRPDKKGISGGERKRTAIAMDVAINPSVLFLDEPTSGLDTYTAFTVMKILHCLTRRGHTVVTTIHQPSSEIFHLFDDLLILAHGRIMYLGEASKSVDYFARLGYQCPSYTNPADFFFMEVIQGMMTIVILSLGVDVALLDDEGEESGMRASDGGGRPVDPDSVKMKRLLSAWNTSPENASIQSQVNDPPTTPVTQYRHKAPFSRQFWYLLGRASKNAIRNPLIIRVRIVQTVVVALFVGLSFVNLNRLSPQQQIQDKAGVIFFMALNQFFSSATSVMTIFAVEKYVFFREYGAGYYGLTAYYSSKVLVEIPYLIIFPALFVLIVYYLVGLNPPFSRYLLTTSFVILSALCGTAIGTLVAATFNDLSVALAILPVILLPLVIYSGFLLNSATIPSYLIWIRYISPTQYAVTGMIKNEFSRPIPNCVGTVQQCSGENALMTFSLQHSLPIGVNLVLMATIYIALVVAAYYVLMYHLWRKRL